MLLPYLEQANLHARINFGVPYDSPINAEAAKVPVAIYLCPSVPERKTMRGRTDYGGLYGQRITTRTETNNGVFIYDEAFSFRDITDGLTTTMAVAEDVGSPDGEWINGNNVFEQSGGINDPRVWKGDNEIRSKHRGGAVVVFCCARTKFLSNSTDRGVLAALITRASGDLVHE